MTIINRILPELRQAYSEFPGFRLEEDLTSLVQSTFKKIRRCTYDQLYDS